MTDVVNLALHSYRNKENMNEGSPRDVLVDLLDRIDNMNQLDKLDCIVVCMRETVGEQTYTYFAQHSPDLATSIGTMELAKQKMIGDIRR